MKIGCWLKTGSSVVFVVLGVFWGCGSDVNHIDSVALPTQESKKDQLGPGLHRKIMIHQGVQRRYRVYVPARYDRERQLPLILDFHGFWGSSGWMSEKSGFKELADEVSAQFPQGFVVAYPDGILPKWGWNAQTCCGPAEAMRIDDEGFVFAVIEHLSSRVNIDPRRIYLTGHSNGSMLTQLMASKYPEFFAAIAPVSSSSFVWEYYLNRAKDRPIPVIMFAGIYDTCVYAPEKCSWIEDLIIQHVLTAPEENVGLEENFSRWGYRNGCTTRIPALAQTQDLESVHTAAFSDCYNGVEVVKWAVKAGHNDVYQNRDPSAQDDPCDADGPACNAKNHTPYVDIARTAWGFMSRFASDFDEIFRDDFEQKNLAKWWLSDDDMRVYTYNMFEHSARLAKHQSMQRVFDLSGFRRVVLRYQWRTRRLDTGEYGYVEWSTDGSHWTELERVERPFDSSWSSSSIRLDEAGGESTVYLRFRNDGSKNNEYFYVDNIVLAASEK